MNLKELLTNSMPNVMHYMIKDLMEEWKKIGTAGRQTDDELWDRFNEARQKFYDRKHDHWKAMNDRFSEVKDIKKDLIEKAKALQDSDQWKATSDKYRDLMEISW